MVAWCGAVLGELHATFVDSKPGGDHALSLVALLVAQPLAQPLALLVGQPVAQPLALLVALPVAQLVALAVACWWWLVVWGCWNGEGRHAVWRCRPCRFCCVVAVSYSPTTYRLQYHWRCRA